MTRPPDDNHQKDFQQWVEDVERRAAARDKASAEKNGTFYGDFVSLSEEREAAAKAAAEIAALQRKITVRQEREKEEAAERRPINCRCGSMARVDSGLNQLQDAWHRVMCSNPVCWVGPVNATYEGAIDAWEEEMKGVKISAEIMTEWRAEKAMLAVRLHEMQVEEQSERV